MAHAQLIDTGEIIDIGENQLRKLSEDIRSLPPCAFLCKIEQVIRLF